MRTNPVCIFQTIGKSRSSLLEVSLDQRAPVQRSLCDVTKTSKTSTPVTKTLSNFTILSYRDVDTSVLPLFTSKALFVAGKGCFGFTKIGPKKCEGSRNFSIVWFLQPGFSRRLEWPYTNKWHGLQRCHRVHWTLAQWVHSYCFECHYWQAVWLR